MKKRNIIFIVIVIVIIVIVVFVLLKTNGNDEKNITFATIKKGTLSISISATGTIEPLSKYPVMASISGRVEKIYVDYNSIVKKGETLAIMEQTDYIAALKNAEIGLKNAELSLKQEQLNYSNVKQLYDKNFKTSLELTTAQLALEKAKLELESAKVSYEKAKQNLENTVLKSPIDGFVLERNVDEGDFISTTSSSLNELFTICPDLNKLRVSASVDESDISSIFSGQKVSFTVLAYPQDIFYGKVSQIRLNATETSNVITYNVIIEATNSDNKLFPGMTASIEFLTESEEEGFLIPTSALSVTINPETKSIGKYRIQLPEKKSYPLEGANQLNAKPNPDQTLSSTSTGTSNNGSNENSNNNSKNGDFLANMKVIWIYDQNTLTLYPVLVRVGSSNGKQTVVYSDKLKDGMIIVSSYINKKKKSNGTNGSNSMMGGPPRF